MSTIGIVATLTGLSGIGIGVLMYGRGSGNPLPAAAKLRAFILTGPIDRFWDTAWRSALLPFARLISWFDRYVVDGAINLSGYATLRGAASLRRLQTGRSQDYVLGVVAGLLFFVILSTVVG
jgi:NAD(P)H-quinone oxidoreductase subunit 5